MLLRRISRGKPETRNTLEECKMKKEEKEEEENNEL